MTTDRCPGCSAAVTPGAPWCTLCYADLRVPVATPAAGAALAVAEPVADPIAEHRPSLADVPRPSLESLPLPPDPILDAPVSVAAPVAGAKPVGWPCLGCGAVMPMSDSACSECGKPFLTAEEPLALALPGVGDLRHMDRGQKIVLVVGIALAVTLLFVAVSYMLSGIL